MSSVARDNFLIGLAAFRSACDEPAVRSSTAVGDFLRRGLTVAAYNLLETFLADRLGELAGHMNSGQTQFLDLPDKLQKRAISQTLEVAVNRMRRSGFELPDLREFSKSVGENLVAVNRSLAISPFTWMWTGSNVGIEEYNASLRYMHVDSPWENVRDLAGRLGFATTEANGGPIDLREDLRSLAAERHQCAHVATYGVTTIWVRAVPERILRLAVGFDVFCSMGADLIRRGDATFLADDKWLKEEKILLRFVRERASDVAETVEGRTRALRVNKDPDTLFKDACGRAGHLEVVVRQTRAGAVVTWSVPSVG